jgi:hypothetical protein
MKLKLVIMNFFNENVIQLQDKYLLLERLSRRADDFFEISNCSIFFCEIAAPDPWSSFSVAKWVWHYTLLSHSSSLSLLFAASVALLSALNRA